MTKIAKGISIVEAIVVTTIVCLIVIISVSALYNTMNSSISFGPTGMVEIRCIQNQKFVVGKDGNARQILGPEGRPVFCN